MTSLLAPIDPSASVRDRILDVAQMLFADHGYTGASTRAIALAAGVNLAQLHYYFGSKRDLFRAAYMRGAEQVTAARRRALEVARATWPEGRVPESLRIGRVVTDLAVLDFGGEDHAPRLLTLHPGVTAAQVQEATGFPIECPASAPVTPAPTAEQLELIRTRLDPRNLRATVFKGDPPGDRR